MEVLNFYFQWVLRLIDFFYFKYISCFLGKIVFWLFYILILFVLFFRIIGDQLGEVKVSGNLGNILKVFGNFDEVVVCCQRYLDIFREFNDKVIRKYQMVGQMFLWKLFCVLILFFYFVVYLKVYIRKENIRRKIEEKEKYNKNF